MLNFFNKRKRSQRWIWILASAILVFGMVAFFAPTRRVGLGANPNSGVEETDPVANVDGKKITAGEYIDGLNTMLNAYQGILSSRGGSRGDMDFNALRGMGMDKTLLEGMIRRKLVEMEVDRLGLEPTDEELKARIREQFSTDGKWIGYDKYKRFIERNGQSVDEYEKSLRLQLAEEKLRTFVTSAIQVSPQEVQQQFNRENTNFNMVYVILDPNELRDKVTYTDADLRSFFDSRKDEFKITQTQRQVNYLFISQEAVGKTVQISDEELKKDYDPEKHLAGVNVSQIMLKILTPKDAETVQQKANDLVARARGSAGVAAEDFAALARGNSQDTATKDKGGDLGFIAKESVKPGSYLQRALTMQVNEISDPIKDGNNYYILKITNRRLKTFEEARETLLASARNRGSYKRTSEIADEALKRLNETKDIKAVAAEIAPKLGVKPEEVVRQTPFFAEGDDVPEIGTNPAFEEATANLKKPGDIGVKVGVRGGFAIPQLVATKEPHAAEFEEVKAKVEQRYKQEKAKEQAAQKARELVAGAANSADGLKAAAEKASLKAETVETYREGMALGSFSSVPQIMSTALVLKEGEVVKEPIANGDKYLVYGVTKRTDPDMTKYNEQSKAIEERLLEDRRQLTFDAYLDSMKKKLKSENKIVVYKETINKIFGSEAPKETAQK